MGRARNGLPGELPGCDLTGVPFVFSFHFLSVPSDGVGRTGAFICIYSVLERVKTEGVADIFQFIKSSRFQRSGLVKELVCVHVQLHGNMPVWSVWLNSFLCIEFVQNCNALLLTCQHISIIHQVLKFFKPCYQNDYR